MKERKGKECLCFVVLNYTLINFGFDYFLDCYCSLFWFNCKIEDIEREIVNWERWWNWLWLLVLLMVFRWLKDWMMVVILKMVNFTNSKSRLCLRISQEGIMRHRGCLLKLALMFSSILLIYIPYYVCGSCLRITWLSHLFCCYIVRYI